MDNAHCSIALVHFATTAGCGSFGKRVTTGTIGLLIFALINAFAHAETAEVDDGWRRTRFGWENIKHWDLTPEQRELPTAAPFKPAILSSAATDLSSLLHPVVLAMGLSVLAIVALLLATPREQAFTTAGSIDLQPGNAV